MKLNLRRIGGANGASHELEWDPVSGKISGKYAKTINAYARDAKENHGGVIVTKGGLHTDKDPLRNLDAMCVLLIALGFEIPQELAGYVPEADYIYSSKKIY